MSAAALIAPDTLLLSAAQPRSAGTPSNSGASSSPSSSSCTSSSPSPTSSCRTTSSAPLVRRRQSVVCDRLASQMRALNSAESSSRNQDIAEGQQYQPHEQTSYRLQPQRNSDAKTRHYAVHRSEQSGTLSRQHIRLRRTLKRARATARSSWRRQTSRCVFVVAQATHARAEPS